MDLIIEELVIEKDRLGHIAKHKVTIEQVFEVIAGDYLVLEGKIDRKVLVCKIKDGMMITVIVGPRSGINRYGLVTARISKKKERMLYQEKFQGEENESKNS